MSDLVAGRYPLFFEEWALDGSPLPPYRQSMSRRDIVTNGTLTSGTLYVVAMAFQPGDIIGAINIAVQTASATPSHGWAAVYSGIGTGATLLQQSPDNVSGFVGSGAAQKFTLNAPILVGGSPAGVAQGAPATTGTASGQPIILGVALFNQATTGGKLDGMTGGSVAGQIVAAGQVALISTVTGVTGAVAPATLAGLTAAAGFLPYVAVTRS